MIRPSSSRRRWRRRWDRSASTLAASAWAGRSRIQPRRGAHADRGRGHRLPGSSDPGRGALRLAGAAPCERRGTILMKTCSRCGVAQPPCEFGTRHRSVDGLQAWCRDCLREYQREYARKHRDPVRHREIQHRYRSRHAAKVEAHLCVRTAVQSCQIVVPLWCQRCGCVNTLHAHHHDYSKPLEVEWLCTTCRGLVHRSYREGPHARL